MVGMVLCVLMMGLVEMGLSWHASTTMSQASRLAARAGAGLPLDARADREALRALVSTLTPDEYGQISYVVLYDAGAGSPMPDTCRTASSAVAHCNRYDRADLERLDDDTAWTCTGVALDRAWCPADRDSTPIAPTLLGVHIEARRAWLTGFFPGSGIDYRATTVMSIVPADY